MTKRIKEKINLLLPLSVLITLLAIGCSNENLDLGINESNNETLQNETILQLRQDLEDLDKENEKLKTNISSLSSENVQLKTSVSSLNNEVAKLKQANLELESKIKNLDAQEIQKTDLELNKLKEKTKTELIRKWNRVYEVACYQGYADGKLSEVMKDCYFKHWMRSNKPGWYEKNEIINDEQLDICEKVHDIKDYDDTGKLAKCETTRHKRYTSGIKLYSAGIYLRTAS